MKRSIRALGGLTLAFVSSGAAAVPSSSFEGEVDYVIPVSTASLKPFATFFVSRFRVFTDEEGKFAIVLPVPRDLTAGQNIEVELRETVREGSRIRFDRDLGTATCDVPRDWDTAKCRYEFNDTFREKVPTLEARKYLAKKYAGDSTLPLRATVVVDEFLESTESVGEASFRSLSSSCPECVVGNGIWRTQYTTANGTVVRAEVELARRQGHYFNSSGSGKLSDVAYRGNVATGTWVYGGSRGWFRFVFQGDSFEGSWGQGSAGTPALGSWRGTRARD